MRIIFRVDASIEMGTGHVMRCLTLADALTQAGAECHFICREHPGHLNALITERGHTVYSLPYIEQHKQREHSKAEELAHASWLGATQEQDLQACIPIFKSLQPDWLVVDHYAIDEQWEKALRPYCKQLMVIDDLADRQHACDLLLDQTFGRSSEDYLPLVPQDCQMLCGAHYALLRPEFAQWRDYSLKRRAQGQLEHLLINLGGVDKDNITTEILQTLANTALPDNCRITVVMGATAPWVERVQQQAALMPWPTEVKVGVNNMAELMANSDLAIGAAGATSWERCCLGLPTIQLVIAENQRVGAYKLAKSGLVKSIKCPLEINDTISRISSDLAQLSKSCAQISDGLGVNRVVAYIDEKRPLIDCTSNVIKFKGLFLEPVLLRDVEQIRCWRNKDRILNTTVSKKKITKKDQITWFMQLNKKDIYLKVIYKNTFIGVVSLKFDIVNNCYDPGVFIGDDEFKSTGIGFAAAFLITYYAFLCLDLAFLEARILKENKPAVRLNIALGYKFITCTENFDLYRLEKNVFFHRYPSLLELLDKAIE